MTALPLFAVLPLGGVRGGLLYYEELSTDAWVAQQQSTQHYSQQFELEG